MSAYDLPGPGDEATWPPYAGHPNDPRAPDDDAGRDDAIDARVADLLAAPAHNPFTPENLCEALGEADISALCRLLTTGDLAGAGPALADVARSYWEPIARREAERQIDREAAADPCRWCRNRRCHLCDE